MQAAAELGRREGLTPFMILLAALDITLHKWTGQQDLVVGTVVAGRNRRELESAIGSFVNFLPLRGRLDGGATGQQLLAQVRATVLDAQAHQECPFEKIVEAIRPARRRNRNPLYNVALLLQNFPAELFRAEGCQTSRIKVPMQAAVLDLRFEVERIEAELCLTCEYKTELFDPTTIERVLSAFGQVAEALVRQPQTKLSGLGPELRAPAKPEPADQAQTHNPHGSHFPRGAAGRAAPLLDETARASSAPRIRSL